MSATEVLQQFRALPPEERRAVAEQIWDETEAGELVETPEMMAELERRAEEAHRNPQDSIPWEQVRAELREKYGWK
jgi:putative addiction module component (TIGR02574 family)